MKNPPDWSIYPSVGPFTVVEDTRHVLRNRPELCQQIEENLDSQWVFFCNEVTDFWDAPLPKHWRDPYQAPPAGIPPNIWVGVRVASQDQVLPKVESLRKIRARRLFVAALVDVDLVEALTPWRCMNCGRRGEGIRPKRCPTGSLCWGQEERLQSQIHWVIDWGEGNLVKTACSQLGVARWTGTDSRETPSEEF